jgi:hypothetical protein
MPHSNEQITPVDGISAVAERQQEILAETPPPTTIELRTYPIAPRLLAELRSRFTYHAFNADQAERAQQLRDVGYQLALRIAKSTKPSREQSLALTHLEEALVWANKAIAAESI